MRIETKRIHGQVPRYSGGPLYREIRAALILFSLVIAACEVKKEGLPVPPPTFPLSQEYIGYGVINVSYTRVTEEPEINSPSPGYLRQGSVVRIYERKQIANEGKSESWLLLVGGSCKGWLKETFVDVYDNESQAQTASEAMVNTG